jgi:hypothetical protein
MLPNRQKAPLCPSFLLNKRIPGRRPWFWSVSLFFAACMTLLAPTAAMADQSAQGQQDFLTTIIWTIAALSIAEMIRNSIQGIFTRLSGLNEAGIAQKAVGAIAGMGALFGLANVMRATAAGHGGGGGSGGGRASGGDGGGIKLSGEHAPSGGGEGRPSGMPPGGEVDLSEDGSPAGLADSLKMPTGHTTGFEQAADVGNKWGNALGTYSRRAATTAAAGALGIAGMAVPLGSRLAQAGAVAADSTIGAAAGYAGSAIGRFAGVQGSMLSQSWQARKQAQNLTGGKISAAEGFRIAAGGVTMPDAFSRSLKFGGAYALHDKAGQFVLGWMKRDAATSRPTTGKMDNGVNYDRM